MGNTDKIEMIASVYDTGGHLMIIDFNKNEDVVSDMVHNGFDQEVLYNQLTRIGFQRVHTKNLLLRK